MFKKSYIKFICFLIIFGCVICYINHILKFKNTDGIYSLTTFYDLDKDTVDVLILGSSHAFENYNTEVFWDQYGIAAYDLGASFQPVWNTYYYYKEALKTQHPKFVVLDVHTLSYGYDYSANTINIKSTAGMKWSKDRYNAVKASVSDDNFINTLMPYMQYHNRYSSLGGEDFYEYKNDPVLEYWNGFYCNFDTYPMENTDLSYVDGCMDLMPKMEEYYRKIIDLSIENNIPILMVVSPYASVTEEDQKRFNQAAKIAEEYSVPFINCNNNYSDMGIDYMYDMGDSSHLNYRGSYKFSTYIGNIIKSNYDIPDRRGDEKYIRWDKYSEFICQQYIDQSIIDFGNLNDIILLLNSEMDVYISIEEDIDYISEEAVNMLSNLGITNLVPGNLYYINNKNVIWDSISSDSPYYYKNNKHNDIMLEKSNKDNQGNKIIIDNDIYNQNKEMINVVIYDNKTCKVIKNISVNPYTCEMLLY